MEFETRAADGSIYALKVKYITKTANTLRVRYANQEPNGYECVSHPNCVGAVPQNEERTIFLLSFNDRPDKIEVEKI